MMKVTRFYTTSNGGSTFDELDLPLVNRSLDRWSNEIAASSTFDSQNVSVFEIADGAVQDWHNAPRRQLCVVLNGEWQVETTDGRVNSWKPGDVFLPDDVEGKGHISRVIEGPVRILFVPLNLDFDLSAWQTPQD